VLEIDGWVQENGSHVVLPLIAANAAFFAKAAGSNHYNPTRGVTQCHKNASFFYIRCTHM